MTKDRARWYPYQGASLIAKPSTVTGRCSFVFLMTTGRSATHFSACAAQSLFQIGAPAWMATPSVIDPATQMASPNPLANILSRDNHRPPRFPLSARVRPASRRSRRASPPDASIG